MSQSFEAESGWYCLWLTLPFQPVFLYCLAILVLRNWSGGVFNVYVVTVSRHNGKPHGQFSIDSQLQSIVVLSPSLQRQLVVNITRTTGLYGRVRVDFALRYDQVSFSLSLLFCYLSVNIITQNFVDKYLRNIRERDKPWDEKQYVRFWGWPRSRFESKKFFLLCIFAVCKTALFHYSSLGVSTNADSFSCEPDSSIYIYKFNTVE